MPMSKTKLILVTAGTVVVIRQVTSLLRFIGIIEKTPNSSPQQSVSNTSFGDLISAQATWSQSKFLTNEPNDLFLQVEVRAKDIGTKHKPLVTTIIVLDRSGSMDGEKIEKTKLATLQAFKSLNAKDTFGIVSYSNHAQVNLRPTFKKDLSMARIQKALNDIYPAGGTNISDGIRLAVNLLEEARTETLYKRILLISDGHATKGVTSKIKLGNLASLAKKKEFLSALSA